MNIKQNEKPTYIYEINVKQASTASFSSQCVTVLCITASL